MKDPRKEAREGVERMLQSSAELRTTLRAAETTLRRALKKMEGGSDLATAVFSTEPTTTRSTITEAIEAAESARHQMRVLIFAAGLEQGMSIGELGRLFGFSRQLAARYAKEARGET